MSRRPPGRSAEFPLPAHTCTQVCAHRYTGEVEVSQVWSQRSLGVLVLSSAAFPFPDPLTAFPSQCAAPKLPLDDHPVLGQHETRETSAPKARPVGTS